MYKEQPVRITPVAQSSGLVWTVFPSMSSCARELGIQQSHISEVCSGKRKTTHGYRFEKSSPCTNKFTCCICGKEIVGWGNNPEPVSDTGECCDVCNDNIVIPARLDSLNGGLL